MSKQELKAVEFNFSYGEERTRTIDIDGYKPFDITFTIPDNASRTDLGVSVGKDGMASGEAVVKFIAKNLKAWTLGTEMNEKNIRAIENVNILSSICAELLKSEVQAKN